MEESKRRREIKGEKGREKEIEEERKRMGVFICVSKEYSLLY